MVGEVVQGVHGIAGGRIEAAVDGVHLLIGAMCLEIRRDVREGAVPLPDLGEGGEDANTVAGDEGGADGGVARRDDALGEAGDIADDLGPDGAGGAAAAAEDAGQRCTALAEGFELVLEPVGDAFEERAVDVCASMGEREADEEATGAFIKDGRPLAVEIGQDDETVAARRDGCGFGIELGVGGGSAAVLEAEFLGGEASRNQRRSAPEVAIAVLVITMPGVRSARRPR